MKRILSDAEDEERPKRSKLQISFYAASIKLVRGLCSREAFHAAKQLVSEQGVHLGRIVEGIPPACVWIQGRVTLNANAAGFPHMLQQPNAEADQAAAPGQTMSVQLCLHGSTGELLDAHSSCCPGGFQAVLGSFCPCVAALLLRAAQQMALPEQAALSPLPGLPPWSGSSVQDVLGAQSTLHTALCLVPQPSCYTTGLGLQPWQYEDRVSSSTRVHFASQRQQGGMYYASRPASDPDKLNSIEDAHEDLANDPWFMNSSVSGLAAPPGLFDEHGGSSSGVDAEPGEQRGLLARSGAAAAGGAAAGAAAAGAAAGAAEGPVQWQRMLLAAAVGKWLSVYGGQHISGHVHRPKVVNLAFELLLGGESGAPGRPLSSLVLLLRGLWEYLHCHGLGRLLAKPLKSMLALRNALLVSDVPLWMRRAVAAQLECWERALLWQHAASPLEVTGAVGLVHLLRALQEARQLCLHHWDEPQLVALLSGPVAEKQRQQQQLALSGARPASAAARFGSGGSSSLAGASQQHAGPDSSSGAAGAMRRTSSASGTTPCTPPPLWQLELPSLLTLRLLMLDTVGQSPAYLELAMAGGAWRKAIDCMLHSKERSQLLKAVHLLPRHITSLSERLGYMRKLLGLESLGIPERLELVARLLLDVREALVGELAKIRVSPSRASMAASMRYGPVAAGAAGYPWHLWEATLYSLQEDATRQDGDAGGAGTARSTARKEASNSMLWTEWGEVMRLFIVKAAQALFEAGRASARLHRQHLQDIGDSPQCDSGDEAAGTQQAGCGAGGSSGALARPGSAGSGPRRVHEQHPPVMPAGMVEAMVQGQMGPLAVLHGQLMMGMLAPVMRYCPDCQGMHPESELRQPPVAIPQPGDPDWRLLDINPEVFSGGNHPSSSMGYPEEARGSLKDRGRTGYIQDAAVLAAYKKVQPVHYPELLPLCSLDALCLATLSSATMAHFDAGGTLDTSLDLAPLRELLGHGLVEMGPAAVRVQAALEAAVYTTVMSPPNLPLEQRDTLYRSLTYQLLGAGQRSLALLVARARFKLCPGARAAGELLEVAVAAGPEAEAAAVDLVLGKGLVRPPDADDEALLRGPSDGGSGRRGGGGPDGPGGPGRLLSHMNAQLRATARRLHRAIADNFYGDPYEHHMAINGASYSDEYAMYTGDVDEDGYVPTIEYEVDALDRAVAFLQDRAARGDADSSGEDGDAGSSGSARSDDEGGEGEQGRPIEILDDDDSDEGQQQAAGAAAVAGLAAAAADGYNADGRAAARLAALQRLRVQQQLEAEAAAAGEGAADAAAADTDVDEQQDEESLDTRQLLGEESAAAIQLRDTASGGRRQAADPAGAGRPAAAAAAAAAGGNNGNGARGAGGGGMELAAELALQMGGELRMYRPVGLMDMADEDDSDMDADEEAELELVAGPYGRYGIHRPVRDLPPADIQPRPKRAAVGSSSRPRPTVAAAAAGGGGGGGSGGGGGGSGDGGGNGGAAGDAAAHARKRSSASGGRRRHSASAEVLGDNQQAALVCGLFGISAGSCSHPGRTLRIHLRRLTGLQLWAVVRYAAGRGAARDSVRRLGLAAWLSDNSSTTSGNAAPMRAADMLRWGPASTSQDSWLDAARQLHERTGTNLQQQTSEPFEGYPLVGNCWSGLPSTNWSSFVAQERLPQSWSGSPLHHSTPDANLAWLLAVLGSSGSSSDPAARSGSDGGHSRCSSREPEAGPCSSAEAAAVAAGERVGDFIASNEFTGVRAGYVYKVGSKGPGYYKDSQPPPAAVAAASAAGGAACATSCTVQRLEVDLSSCSELLQQLAVLSKGTRYGLPMLQLCHALLTAGDRSACLSLLPQALLPAGFGLQALTPNSCMVAALQELMPVAAKHGDVSLRVSAAVTYLLLTRRPLPVSVLGDPDVLAGVLSWWCGLVGALHGKPEEWRHEKLTALPGALNPGPGGPNNNWTTLQRLLVRCVLPSLGAQQQAQQLGIMPGGGLRDLGGAPLAAQQGYAMLLACAAVKKAPWPLQLYLSRLCWVVQLAPDLPSLGGLLCPALEAAVQAHLAGLSAADKEPPADMAAWKAHRSSRVLTTQASLRARDWVAATVSWLATELSSAEGAAGSSAAAAASGRCRLAQPEFGQFVDSLCDALHGWHGPELLPLAVAMQQQQAAQQQHTKQQAPQAAVLRLLSAGLLPAVGRADEVAASTCVRTGSYKSALLSLMRDEGLLEALPQDLARSLALTYWYQEATPAALLTANDMLLKLEGAGSAQALQLPQGTGLSAALAAAAGASGTAAGPSAAAAGSLACRLGTGLAVGGSANAALPQVHGVLLEQLDLVPSRGGLEAAGLRFLQLQVHAGNGQYEAALESVFNAPPDNGSRLPGTAATLSSQMEVADAVLRLVTDNAATPSIGGLLSSPPYQALLGLGVPGACCEGGPGDSLLAGLSSGMQVHLLRLQIWRLCRHIISRPPGVSQRINAGPQFLTARGYNQAVYNAVHMPPAPSWMDPELLQRWVRLPLPSLLTYIADQGLLPLQGVAAGSPAAAAHVLCSAFQAQEESLLWCVLRYAGLVPGVQLERDLCSLISQEQRCQLGQLPVFAMGLGQELKDLEERGRLMWAYGAFRNTPMPTKVSRYIHRNAHDQASLQRYLVKSTVSELQAIKADCMPWWCWDMGQKAHQAAELAEWLWWLAVTWPRTRAAAGAGAQPVLPGLAVAMGVGP